MSDPEPIIIDDEDAEHFESRESRQNATIYVSSEDEDSSDDNDVVMGDGACANINTDNSSLDDEDDDVEFLGGCAFSVESVHIPPASRREKLIHHHGFVIEARMAIEYIVPSDEPGSNERSNPFFWISKLWRSPNQQVYLEGLPLRRNTSLHGQLDRKRNELSICMTLPDTRDDACFRASSTVILLPAECWKRDVTFTNAPAPRFVERPRSLAEASSRHQREHGHLYCRWLYMHKTRAGDEKVVETVTRRLRQEECPTNAECPIDARCVDDDDLRDQIRRTGKYSRIPARSNVSPSQRQYNSGDVFAGAGGISRAQYNAGLRLHFAVEYDKDAVLSLEKNELYERGRVFCIDVHDFVTKRSGTQFRVDILHLSPPCQAYSPANPGGRHDEKNIATGFCIGELIDKTMPRLVTVEQTFGIKHRQWIRYYHKLLQQFTHKNYSTRVRVESFADFGCVHARRRLIIIAACPGEPLPTMSEPTHGPGRRPYTTVADRLRSCYRCPPPAHMLHSMLVSEDPFDACQPLRHCVTTAARIAHPDGTRTFNLAELGSMQDFPYGHQFVGTPAKIQRQIANAVPPVFGETLFRHLVKALRKADEETERRRRGRR